MKDKGVVSRINSASEPDLTTAGRNTNGFPPGITVDELWLYRRKRPSANLWPHDNLKLDEGSFKSMKSEYSRRFKNYYDFSSCGDIRGDISPVRATKPEDTLQIEGVTDFHSLYNEDFIEYPVEKPLRSKAKVDCFEMIDPDEMKENPSERLLTEITAKYIKYPFTERPPLLKRPTTLKLEGDLYTTTEQAEKFIQYLLNSKPHLLRKPTTLKLEGDMNTNTENRDKFVAYDLTPRPPLCKKFTNLHLEGDHHILSEKQEKFIRYEVQKRPPLTKKGTNLVIEGELNYLPEYRREFIEYKTERPKLSLPVNNLKTDGFYDVIPDVSAALHHQIHPEIPNLRNSGTHHEDLVLKARLSRTRENSFRLDAPKDIETENVVQFVEKPPARAELVKVENNLKLHGRIDVNPEYRNAYIDFKPASTPRRRRQEGHLKTEGKMEVTPEYRCSYVDFPRSRPQIKRPECSLSSEGEMDHLTEQNEKYVPFPNAPRAASLKRQPELKLEGNIECQPEYRKAYIDYLIRERVDRKHRPLDNLGQIQASRVVDEESVIKTTLTDTSQAETASNVEEKPPKSAQSNRNKSARNRSLSQIESSVFGPKLSVPTVRKSSSRSSSPEVAATRRSRTVPKSRKGTSPDTNNKNRTFGNPVLVQNLASRSTTPVLPMVDVSAKNKWMRDSSIESSNAFIVLDKNVKNAFNRRTNWNRNAFE